MRIGPLDPARRGRPGDRRARAHHRRTQARPGEEGRPVRRHLLALKQQAERLTVEGGSWPSARKIRNCSSRRRGGRSTTRWSTWRSSKTRGSTRTRCTSSCCENRCPGWATGPPLCRPARLARPPRPRPAQRLRRRSAAWPRRAVPAPPTHPPHTPARARRDDHHRAGRRRRRGRRPATDRPAARLPHRPHAATPTASPTPPSRCAAKANAFLSPIQGRPDLAGQGGRRDVPPGA